jgi:cobalamin biosynthesis protein CobT
MGTPESIKRKRAFREQDDNEKGSEGTSSSDNGEEKRDGEDEGDGASEQSSSSSPSEDEGGEKEHQQQSDQVMESAIDLSVSPTEPDKTCKETSAAPANRLSFKQALEITRNNRAQDAAIGTSTGTDSVPAHRKLITLSSLGNKKDDSANKRTRTLAEQPSVQEQPASKKPP